MYRFPGMRILSCHISQSLSQRIQLIFILLMSLVIMSYRNNPCSQPFARTIMIDLSLYAVVVNYFSLFISNALS